MLMLFSYSPTLDQSTVDEDVLEDDSSFCLMVYYGHHPTVTPREHSNMEIPTRR